MLMNNVEIYLAKFVTNEYKYRFFRSTKFHLTKGKQKIRYKSTNIYIHFDLIHGNKITINSLLLYIGRGIIISTFLAPKWPLLLLVPFKGPKKSWSPLKVSIFVETPLKWTKLWLFCTRDVSIARSRFL